MEKKHLVIGVIGSGLTFALAVAASLPVAARTAQHAQGAHDMVRMQHVMTQAQADALKPGDTMAMACSKCKNVMVQTVTTDKAHVKMMTVGEKATCDVCGGTVTVVATGKGKGNEAEVKHVCSKCGDSAMYCAATKPGSGSMRDMK